MTKRDRAQVVELLRCAADSYDVSMIPLTRAARNLGLADNGDLWWTARNARIAVEDGALWPDQRTSLLEAALRIERGWTP